MVEKIVVHVDNPDVGQVLGEVVKDIGSEAILVPGGLTQPERDEAAKKVASLIVDDTAVVVWDLGAAPKSGEEIQAIKRLQREVIDAGVLGTRRVVLLTTRNADTANKLLGELHGLLPEQGRVVRMPFDIAALEAALRMESPSIVAESPVAVPVRRTQAE